MSTTRNDHSIATLPEVLRIILCFVLLTDGAPAQVGQNEPGKAATGVAKDNVADAMARLLQEAMDRLKQGSPSRADVIRIGEAGAVQAIPDLEKLFAATGDGYLKGATASALVRLRDAHTIYWDYLVKEATAAVQSDAPYPERFDQSGKLVGGRSAEFTAWAKAHNFTFESAFEESTLRLPSGLAYITESGDPRAIPLLRQALSSPNFMIQAAGARGLMQLQDRASIPLIIEACQKAPPEAAFAISQGSLLEFNDPRAQSAAKEFAAANEAARSR